jgi:hypothetical protein
MNLPPKTTMNKNTTTDDFRAALMRRYEKRRAALAAVREAERAALAADEWRLALSLGRLHRRHWERAGALFNAACPRAAGAR